MDASVRPWSRFAARLVAARMRAGMTQVALAKACGDRSNSWVVQLESGASALPRQIEDVLRIAEVLDVGAEWLLFGKTFEAGPHRLALGVGGADVAVAPRGRNAELLLYRGAWIDETGHAVRADALLCTCDPVETAASGGSRHIYLLDDRGERVVASGRLNRKGQIVDAAGQDVLTRRRARVVGLCWPASR